MKRTAFLERMVSELSLTPGRRVGAVRIGGAQMKDGAVRVFLAWTEREFWVDLFPRREGRPCFARTPSFDLRCSPLNGREEIILRPALESLAERISRADSGGWSKPLSAEAGGIGKNGAQEARRCVEKILSALPCRDLPPARVFRGLIRRLLSSGAVPPQAVEASLSFGESSFRALANVTAGDQPSAAFQETALAFMDAFGVTLPRVRKAALAWLERRAHDLHFGLACGSGRARLKVYFSRARDAGGSGFGDILRELNAPAGAADSGRAPEGQELDFVAIDLEKARVSAFKAYWRLRPGRILPGFKSGLLLRLLASEGAELKGCPMILCRRFDARGGFLDESLHAGVSLPVLDPAGAALKYARLCGAREEARRLEKMFRGGTVLRRAVLSETAGRDRGRHVYLTAVSPEAAGAPSACAGLGDEEE